MKNYNTFRFKNNFKIEKKLIGLNHPSFIIAEIGINHLGSKKICIQMIRTAIKSGADAVKLQIIDAEESYSKETRSYKIFNKYKLSSKDLIAISNFCKKNKIILFATPGDFKSLRIIKKLKMPAIKISSGLLTNLPLIDKASKLQIPIILSSGMSYFSEIVNALNIIHKNKNYQACVLKCTSLYPADDKSLNLTKIIDLKEKLNMIIGYSDHTINEIACMTAVSLGAKVIEKHFTTNRNLKFADNKISMEPNEFKRMVFNIRRIEKMITLNKNLSSNGELKKRQANYRHLMSSDKILKGELFTSENIGLKRTNKKGERLVAKFYFNILGKKSKFNYKKGQLIKKQ